jgi:hypothetical protein
LNQFKIRKKLKQFCVDTCLSRRNWVKIWDWGSITFASTN